MREIPQCTKCQRYGYTKNFYFHKTSALSAQVVMLPQNAKRKRDVKCVACKDNHSINYKGCRMYKELQSDIFSLRKKKINPPTQWKVTQIIMIQKPKKDPTDIKSYYNRPINLLLILSKLFEKLLLQKCQ